MTWRVPADDEAPCCDHCGCPEARRVGHPWPCSGGCNTASMTTPTLRDVPLSDDEARELSRAAKQVAAFTERRNQLIRDALTAGHGVREVARATGLNHTTVLNIQSPKKRGGTS